MHKENFKNLNLLCFDSKNWIGNGNLIPSGPLREPLTSIKLANFIVIKGEKNQFIEKEIKTICPNIEIIYTENEVENIEGIKIEFGRFFNEKESVSGATVIVLGYEVAEGLFGNVEDAKGKKIRLYGQRFTVIGVIKKEGLSNFGESKDNTVFIPVNYIRRLYGDNAFMFTPVIIIKPKKDVDIEEFKAELSQKLRSYRGIKAGEIDNFFIDVLSGFTDLIDELNKELYSRRKL